MVIEGALFVIFKKKSAGFGDPLFGDKGFKTAITIFWPDKMDTLTVAVVATHVIVTLIDARLLTSETLIHAFDCQLIVNTELTQGHL